MANVIFKFLEDIPANIAASKRALLMAFDSTLKRIKYFDATVTEYELLTLDSTGTPTRTIAELEIDGDLISGGAVDIGTATDKLEITDTYAYLMSNGEKIIDYLHANGYVSIGGDGDNLDVAIFGTDLVNPIFWSDAGLKRVGVGTDTPMEKLEVNGSIGGGDIGSGSNSDSSSIPKINKALGSTTDSVINYILICKTLTSAGTFASNGFDGEINIYRGTTAKYNNIIKINISAKNAYATYQINKFDVYKGQTIPSTIDMVTLDYGGSNYLAIRLTSMSSHDVFYTGRSWNTEPSIKAAADVSNIVAYRNPTFIENYNGDVGINCLPTVKLEIKNSATNTTCIAVQRSGDTQQIVRLGEDASGHGRIYVLDNAATAKIALLAGGVSYINSGSGLVVGGTAMTASERFKVTGGTLLDGAVIINESGADVDVRIEGDTDTNLLVTNAGLEGVAIGSDTPEAKLHVQVGTGPTIGAIIKGIVGGESHSLLIEDTYNIRSSAAIGDILFKGYAYGGTQREFANILAYVGVNGSSSQLNGRLSFRVANATGVMGSRMLIDYDKIMMYEDIYIETGNTVRNESGVELLPHLDRSSYGSAVSAAHICPPSKQLTSGSAIGLFEVALPTSGQTCAGSFSYRIHCWNGTDFQVIAGIANYVAGNKAGTITSVVGHTAVGSGLETELKSSGTLTDAFSATNGTGKVTINVTATTSLTPGANEFYIVYTLNNDSQRSITIL